MQEKVGRLSHRGVEVGGARIPALEACVRVDGTLAVFPLALMLARQVSEDLFDARNVSEDLIDARKVTRDLPDARNVSQK
eukprot:1446878-Rhodomonas_salina.1